MVSLVCLCVLSVCHIPHGLNPFLSCHSVTKYTKIPTKRLEGGYLASLHQADIRDDDEAWRRDFMNRGKGLGKDVTNGNHLYNSLGPTHIQQNLEGWGQHWQPNGPAATFLHYVTQPRVTCRRLVRMGGRSCSKHFDGDKLVCFDPGLGLPPDHREDCLVVGVGVGHDLSFDTAVTRLPCHAHAFDDDQSYRWWARDQGPLLTFHRGRLGTLTGNFTFCDQYVGLSSCTSYLHYTLQDMMLRIRGSEGRGEVQYLKMDIEGAEWEVVSQALRHGWLRNVRQLAIEIHLEDLRDPVFTETEQRDAASFYLHVFAGLEAEGLGLAAFIPNSLNPETTRLDGKELPCYGEMLWLRH
ncbi:hypothetical protein Pcinc_005341 [Petrolisthes cinctipes]|uniref:Methyltransferase domain-containing protein n=1 Tax=Petrolisthes cinctipes TaxID=88211 RepID=A0AAE1GF25_PETCI|nr:hypothetical protein Pcinc_005341 [Petrolisthes cinctipes]